ncbi:MAG: cupredoxin domain-containing protein [Nitrospiraceae bacterium]
MRARSGVAWKVWVVGPMFLLAWLIGSATAAPPIPTLAPTNTDPEEQVLVKIRARQFEPTTVTLHAGRKTRLVFQNHDAELHAFVPIGLFVGVSLNISGNGAPEFGHEGFKRVIIPSEGRAEILFVPERTGVYPFLCDMPGHDMRATIVVQ